MSAVLDTLLCDLIDVPELYLRFSDEDWQEFAAEWQGPFKGERGGTYWISPEGNKSYEPPPETIASGGGSPPAPGERSRRAIAALEAIERAKADRKAVFDELRGEANQANAKADESIDNGVIAGNNSIASDLDAAGGPHKKFAGKFVELDEVVTNLGRNMEYLSPSEKYQALKEIEKIATQAQLLNEKLKPGDVISQEDIDNNRLAIQKVIEGTKAAREHLKRLASARREMRAIKERQEYTGHTERFAADGWRGPFEGPRGGQFWVSPSGEKSYEEPGDSAGPSSPDDTDTWTGKRDRLAALAKNPSPPAARAEAGDTIRESAAALRSAGPVNRESVSAAFDSAAGDELPEQARSGLRSAIGGILDFADVGGILRGVGRLIGFIGKLGAKLIGGAIKALGRFALSLAKPGLRILGGVGIHLAGIAAGAGIIAAATYAPVALPLAIKAAIAITAGVAAQKIVYRTARAAGKRIDPQQQHRFAELPGQVWVEFAAGKKVSWKAHTLKDGSSGYISDGGLVRRTLPEGAKAEEKKESKPTAKPKKQLSAKTKPAAKAKPTPKAKPAAQPAIDAAHTDYELIKKDIPNLSIEELRSRAAGLAKQPKAVLAGVLTKLGYPADGTQAQLAAQLLDNLTSLKVSNDQTKQINDLAKPAPAVEPKPVAKAKPEPKPPGSDPAAFRSALEVVQGAEDVPALHAQLDRAAASMGNDEFNRWIESAGMHAGSARTKAERLKKAKEFVSYRAMSRGQTATVGGTVPTPKAKPAPKLPGNNLLPNTTVKPPDAETLRKRWSKDIRSVRRGMSMTGPDDPDSPIHTFFVKPGVKPEDVAVKLRAAGWDVVKADWQGTTVSAYPLEQRSKPAVAYHVLPRSALASVQKDGLLPGSAERSTKPLSASHAVGKTFLTDDPKAAAKWKSEFDDPDLVTVQVDMSKVSAPTYRDQAARSADPGSFYLVGQGVPPEAITVIDAPKAKPAPKPPGKNLLPNTTVTPPEAIASATASTNFNRMGRTFPKESRPPLTPQEVRAIDRYSNAAHRPLNEALRADKPIPATHVEIDEGLQSAFGKTQNFPAPTIVRRGANLTQAELRNFNSEMATAFESGQPIQMKGYTSTTNKPGTFKGNVEFRIAAVNGIDMRPNSAASGERELLLDRKARYRVKKVETKRGKTTIHLEQLRKDE